jgi:putative endonuclease
MWNYNYYAYITTNQDRTLLYVGTSKEGCLSIEKTEGNGKLLLEGIFVIILFGLNTFLILMKLVCEKKRSKVVEEKKKELLIAKSNPDWKTIKLKRNQFHVLSAKKINFNQNPMSSRNLPFSR